MNDVLAQSTVFIEELLTQPMVLLIVIPLIAGVLCCCIPNKWGMVSAAIATLTGIYTLFLVWPLFKAGEQIYQYSNWLFFRLDGSNSFILLATVVFGVLIVVYSLGYTKGSSFQSKYYMYILWTIGASCGALLASEFILLLIFWGFLGITLYQLTGISGPDAAGAAKKTFIIIGGSDSILIMGVALLWLIRHTTQMHGAPVELTGPLSYTAFFCFVIAAFAKAGAMPFHSWVPDCGEKAPASVAAFLPASLDKLLGIYFLIRIIGIFKMNGITSGILAFIGAATILLAVMMALVQHDLKRLLSYHAVSQVGYMILGISTGTPIGLAGGMFHMLNNALYKSCLFLCAGSIEKRIGTTDMDKLGGLVKTMPLTFFACLICSLSIAGIPPLNGFASKWMIYQGLIEASKSGNILWILWLTAAMLGSALTLASFSKLLHAAFLRKPSPEVTAAKPREVEFTMLVPMLLLTLSCIVFGIRYIVPLNQFIIPALSSPLSFSGKWFVGSATLMLFVALIAGFLFYLLGTAKKPRECKTYIGGEYIDEVYIADTAMNPTRDVEVTGVDFYQTVRDMNPFKTLYSWAEKKAFDLYDVGIGIIFYFVEALRKAHNGVLPRYLTWFLAGLILISALLTWRVG